MTTYAEDFVSLCQKQRGDRYVYGAEASFSDPDPDAFDCSELVQWALHRIGVYIPDGSYNQMKHCSVNKTLIPVDDAIDIRGALLFRTPGKPGHVAVSRGDGTTIEARGRNYGVNNFKAAGRTWTHGARVPDLSYKTAPQPPVPHGPKPKPTKPPEFHISKTCNHKAIRVYHLDCEFVNAWQHQMQKRGWRIVVDGDFGPASRSIMQDFQKEKGMLLTTELDKKTADAAWLLPVT